MFPQRVIEELGLAGLVSKRSPTNLQGVGGDKAPRMQVRSMNLPAFKLSGEDFGSVHCLLVSRDGYDLSYYTHGTICGELLSRSRMVVDYPRRRMAFVPPSI